MSNQIGIIGIGVMGRNLALNIADKGYYVAGYDKDPNKIEEFNRQGNSRAKATASLKEFVNSLEEPRKIILLVPAGAAVDAVIHDLLPYLNSADILIDGGNSHFIDTNHRQKTLSEQGLHFLGMGISGGEEGARFGPCMMPGGEREAYEKVRPILEAIAAQVDHEPCIKYLGPGSAGHYVKMVHNGIEYGLMQMIAEAYECLKNGLNFNDAELHQVFSRWNGGRLQSFLIEITAQIFLKKNDQGKPLIDVILDVAKQKGTGMWTSQSAMELQFPVPTIDIAVSMRDLSGFKYQWKINQNSILKGPNQIFDGNRDDFLKKLENALYMGFILTYEQGLSLLRVASNVYHYDLNLADIAQIWRGGCIIRSALLDKIMKAFERKPDLNTLLQDPEIGKELSLLEKDLRSIGSSVIQLGLPIPALLTSLSTYDAFRGSWLPTNLIQAQRDFFGAHTYERIDMPGIFHTEWKPRIDHGHAYHE